MTTQKNPAQARAKALPSQNTDAAFSGRTTHTTSRPAPRSRRQYRSWALTDPVVCAALILIDWLTIFASSMAAWFIYHQLFGAQLGNWRFYVASSSVLALIFVANGMRSSVYGFLWGVDRQERLVKVFRSFLQSYLLFVTMLVMVHSAGTYSRATLVLQFALCGTAILALRSFQFGLLQRLQGSSRIVSNRVILVGTAEELQAISRKWKERDENVEVVDRFVIDATQELRDENIADVAEQVVSRSRERNPDRIVVLLPFEQRRAIDCLVEKFLQLPVSVLVSTDSLIAMHGRPSMLTFGGMSMMRVVRRPMSATDRIAKRVFDFITASLLLVIAAPLLAFIAIAILVESGRPVLFRQRRKGFNQKEFAIYKFRTMRVQAADAGFAQTARGDRRITRVGRFLRRWNFDELPQLINVVRGEMSLVGPRPHAVEHDELYYAEIAAYARRHNMKPGITGLAQALGFRGATDTVQQMQDRVSHDLIYIQNWSLLLDFKIMLMTVFSPRAYRNAY